MEKITLVGGGLAGSLVAIYLAKRGYEVNLYERRPDMRNNRISAGRSINLALSVRGVNALKRVGLDDEVLSDGIPMNGRMMHAKDGELSYQPYGKEGQAIYSVSRGRLNIRLLELADQHDNIHLHFETRCLDVDLDTATCVFEDAQGQTFEVAGDRVIGTDGAFSAARMRMQKTDRFDYSQSYLKHGYKELTIPPVGDGGFAIDKNCLHIWPRGEFMMIALPNPAGDFTCTLFFPFEGPNSFASLQTEQQVLDFFNAEFGDAVPMMPTLVEDYFNNPTSSLVTVRCDPWVYEDKLALLGDAAHAVVPFYGQGMNCAFEDCVVLDDCLERHGNDWTKVLQAYQEERIPNANAIADLALQNFIEMRDKVGDQEFLHRKHIEHELSEHHPDLFKSQYELVTFSNVPYREALAQGAQNDRLLDRIISDKLEDRLTDAQLIADLIRDTK